MRPGYPTYISASTTEQIVTGPCVLERIVIGETAAGAISVYDATSGTSNERAQLKSSITEGVYEFNMHLKNGCRVAVAADSKITVVVS